METYVEPFTCLISHLEVEDAFDTMYEGETLQEEDPINVVWIYFKVILMAKKLLN